jgi:PTS system nitrogen regulatory IIA component
MNDDILLSTLIERGGVYYEIAGTSVETVMTEFIKSLPDSLLPVREDRNFKAALLRAALEREDLMSTGIGRGIALPHPRNPMADEGTRFAAVGFTAHPVDWKALDGRPVRSILFVVSASPRDHLHTLSKINFLCMDEKFISLLEDRASPETIVQTIQEVERSWKR